MTTVPGDPGLLAVHVTKALEQAAGDGHDRAPLKLGVPTDEYPGEGFRFGRPARSDEGRGTMSERRRIQSVRGSGSRLRAGRPLGLVVAAAALAAASILVPIVRSDAATAAPAPDDGGIAGTITHDGSLIATLEHTVDSWDVPCATTEDIDGDLDYAQSALDANDPLGARVFLKMAEDDAADGDAGYVAPDHRTTLDDDATTVFDSVPQSGTDHDLTGELPTLPRDSRCPSLDSFDLAQVATAGAQATAAVDPSTPGATSTTSTTSTSPRRPSPGTPLPAPP